MPSLWFVMPVHGRVALAQICMRQLRRTCDSLTEAGIDATCVVVGDDENLTTARSLGFGVIERDNYFTSRKFCDGIQLALDRRYNPRPADYVVPIGSDDFVDHRLFLDLPDPYTMVGFRTVSFVREDGGELMTTYLSNHGGCGIRIYPRALMAPLNYRPADEDRKRGCDTSILTNLLAYWNGGHVHDWGAEVNMSGRMRIEYRHLHERQIVDFKTEGTQLNTYQQVEARRKSVGGADPWEELAGLYPDEALEEMRAHYERTRALVAA